MTIKIENRRARAEYEILRTFEAGMVLSGSEVKSIRAGSCNLKSGWVSIRDNACFLENISISRWKFSNENHESIRSRKLLLTKKEIRKIASKIKEKGVTVFPLAIFSRGKFLKCTIGIGKGRQKHEKRELLRARAAKRESDKALKNFNS